MTYYVYIVENTVNEKLYVGKCSNPRERWTTHKYIAKGGLEKYPTRFKYFHKGMRKNGIDNFQFNIIEVYSTEQEAFLAETYWIKYLKDFGIKLYNTTDGGEGPSGMKHTEETKEKLRGPRPSLQGENHPLYGIGHTEESKKKISETRINNGVGKGEKNSMFGRTGESAPAWNRTGEKHPNTKLTDTQFLEIEEALKSDKYTQHELVLKYNVSDALISNIRKGKARKNKSEIGIKDDKRIKINSEQLGIIIEDLKNNQHSINQVAKKYGIAHKTVVRIKERYLNG